MLSILQRSHVDKASLWTNLVQLDTFDFTLLDNVELFSFITLFEDKISFFKSYDFEPVNQLKLLEVIQLVE